MLINVVLKELKEYKISKKNLDKIITHGFDDYNNDYSEEIQYILEEIIKNPKIKIEDKDIFSFLERVIYDSDISIIFDNFEQKNIKYNQEQINLILEKSKGKFENKNKFFEYVFEQKDLMLSDLFILKVLVTNKVLGEKILNNDSIKLSNPLINFVKNHYFYKSIVENKTYPEKENESLKLLSNELLKSENYLNEFKTQIPKVEYDQTYLESFLERSYNLIFDESNNNRDKFEAEIVKKKVQTAVDTVVYQKVFRPMTIEEFREKKKLNPNSVFKPKSLK